MTNSTVLLPCPSTISRDRVVSFVHPSSPIRAASPHPPPYREKIELEKRKVCLKRELEKARTFGLIEIEKERLQEIRRIRE